MRNWKYPCTLDYMATRKFVRWHLDDLVNQVRSVCEIDEHGCWLWAYRGSNAERYPEIMIGRKRQNVSRLILEATTGVIGEVARHTCDRPRCCNPAHLLWGSYADNTQDAIERGRMASGDQNPSRRQPERLARGESHGRSVLTEQQVREIRVQHAQGVSGYALANKYNVTKRTIQQIVRKVTWKHI